MWIISVPLQDSASKPETEGPYQWWDLLLLLCLWVLGADWDSTFWGMIWLTLSCNRGTLEKLRLVSQMTWNWASQKVIQKAREKGCKWTSQGEKNFLKVMKTQQQNGLLYLQIHYMTKDSISRCCKWWLQAKLQGQKNVLHLVRGTGNSPKRHHKLIVLRGADRKPWGSATGQRQSWQHKGP